MINSIAWVVGLSCGFLLKKILTTQKNKCPNKKNEKNINRR